MNNLKEILQVQGIVAAQKAFPNCPPPNVLRGLIIPKYEKPFWDIYAEYLCALPANVFSLLAVDLLVWTQDLNWPGCDRIIRQINCLPPSVRTQVISTARFNAQQENDDEWLYNLNLVFGSL